MPISYPDILEERSDPQSFTYSQEDLILYALSIGVGSDPLNPSELPFVYEHALRGIPTAATVLHKSVGQPVLKGRTAAHRSSSLNNEMIVHAEQKTEFHRPLPISGTFIATTKTIAAIDKGERTGAIIVNETVWTDAAAQKVVTLTSSILARADGGFGGPRDSLPSHTVPTRAPDKLVELPTRPDQALLYRLNGDLTPLHADPAVARRAGFDRPILHGLCTYGITCRAVLQEIVAYDESRILSHEVRFSAPVLPGDTLIVKLWQDANIVSFEAYAKERNAVVVKNGKAVLR